MPGHWVIFTVFAWGHLRPESNLAVTLARNFPDVTISFIVDADFAGKAHDEMKRHVALGDKEDVLSRIRVMPLGRCLAAMTPEIAAMFATMDPRWAPTSPPDVVQRITGAFDAMMEEKPFTDDAGTTWEPIAKPNFMICDLMMGHICPPLKRKYGLPLYMWFVGSATSFTRVYGPTEKGGRSPHYVEECHAIEADKSLGEDKTFSQITQHVWAQSSKFKDDIVHVPGLPPFYQWEDLPQNTWYPSFYESIAAGYPLVQMCDGVLLPSVLDIEKEGIDGVVEWFTAGTDRKVLSLGPQLPPDYFSPSADKKSERLAGTEVRYEYSGRNSHSNGVAHKEVDPCITFLDEALKEHGVHSAIYISFGSIFFAQPAHVALLIECILALEKPMPFIFTAASHMAALSEGLVKKISESGRGLIVPWAPQQAILAHTALGYIVSHCGGGGTYESLSQGVPVIAWPFIWDQPPHALWMSQVLDTGFELLQVRNGPIKGKAFRGGPNGTEFLGTDEAIKDEINTVLAACQGHEGKRKRANAEKVKQLIWEARQPGGQVEQHLDVLRSLYA